MIKKHLVFFFPFFLAAGVFFSCGSENLSHSEVESIFSGQSTDDDSFGTVANRPKPAFKNIFPDFERGSLRVDFASQVPLSGDSDDIPREALYVYKSMRELREKNMILTRIGKEVAEEMSTAGIHEFTEAVQSFSFRYDTPLFAVRDWTIEVLLEPGNSTFVRFHFREKTSGRYYASYTVQFDDDGTPLSGLFVSVRPGLFGATSGPGVRLDALAYNYSDRTNLRIVVRQDRYHQERGRYSAIDIHRTCNEAFKVCTAEYLEIITPEPQKLIDVQTNIRFTWNGVSSCVAPMTYSGGVITQGSTYWIEREGESIQMNGCRIPMPPWGGHYFIPADLVDRWLDTNPPGGDALFYYGSGFSANSWNEAIDPSQISGWLDGSGL